MPLTAFLAVVAALAHGVQDPAPSLDQPCRLFGALVDEAGAPIADVTLNVIGWQANAERARRFGVPPGWQNPASITTGDDGEFSLSFVPPRAFQFLLEASAPGFGRAAWRWNELEPGQGLDLGAVTLQREAVLVGNILDGQGNLLVEGWEVTASHGVVAGPRGRTTVSARSFIDPATGQFRLAGLPPGEWCVEASKGSVRIDEARVRTRRGEETFLELHDRSTDPRRQLAVTIDTRPYFPFGVALGSVHAFALDGTCHALVPMPGRVSEWYAPDVTPGTYRVEVRDPRYVDWTKEAVRTGLTYRAHVVGNAALRVTVVDSTTGASVEAYDLAVGYRSESHMELRIRERSSPSPIGGLYTGVVPGDLWVAVDAEGWPTARVDVGELAPGETRDVTVTLVPSTTLHGRVVDPAGRPVAGVDVQWTRGEYPGHDRASGGVTASSGFVGQKQVNVRIGYRDGATTTADDGSFTIEGLGQGTHALLARRGPWNEVWETVELPRPEPLELTLPDAALTSVRLLLPAGESAEGLRLSKGLQRNERHDVARAARTTLLDHPWRCDAAGVFPVRHLPLGVHRLELWREEMTPTGNVHDQLLGHELTVTETAATQQQLDLRETYPVRVTLRTPLPSVEPNGFWVLGVELVGKGRPRQTSSGSSHGSDGKMAHTIWRVPGTYRVVVSAPGLRWTQPEPVHVVRGAPNDFEVPVPLIGREVRVLGEDGAPLVNTVVVYWTDARQRAVGTTDADGVLAVVLLEGTLSLAFPPRQDPGIGSLFLNGLSARATSAFGPGAGPLELRFGPE